MTTSAKPRTERLVPAGDALAHQPNAGPRPRQYWPTRPGPWIATLVGLSLSFIFLLPIIWMFFAAFRTNHDLLIYPPSLFPRDWTLSNFTRIFKELPFGRLYLNTIIFAGAVTISSVFLDSMSAYALARLPFRGSSVVFGSVVALLMMPFQATLIPLYLLMHTLGLVNTVPGLVIPRLTSAFGIFYMRQFFLSLPTELDDAARVDGASEWRIFRQVIAPLAKPAFLTLGLFCFQANWNDLIWPLIMTNSPNHATLPAGLSLFSGDQNIPYGVIMAGSVLSLLPVVVLFVLVQRVFVQGIATTGAK